MNGTSDPNTLSPEERAAYEEQERQRAMAETRAKAQEQARVLLAEQGVPGYGAPPGVQIGPPPPPAPPPPKQEPLPTGLGMWEGLASQETGQPIPTPKPPMTPEGQAFKEGAQASEDVGRQAVIDEATGEAPPPPPQSPGGGGTVIPGGFYPDKMGVETKLGKPVPAEARAAYGAATALQLDAAGKRGASDQQFHNQEKEIYQGRLAAAEAARADMLKLNAQKDAEVQKRLNDIESFSRASIVKPEDTFNDRILAGRALAALFSGLGFASGNKTMAFTGGLFGGVMNGIVDEDIASRLRSKKSMGQAAEHSKDLLSMYLRKFGDQERAIQAMKLNYWDSTAAALDAYEAENQGRLDPVKVQERRAEILAHRGDVLNHLAKQEAADVAQSFSQKYHMPQYVGGGGGGGSGANADLAAQTITIPDADGKTDEQGRLKSTTYHIADKELYRKAVARLEASAHLLDINKEIQRLRKETYAIGLLNFPGTDDFHKRQANLAQLKQLEQDKIDFTEKLHEQGVVREGEYPRKQALAGHAVSGLEQWPPGPWREAEWRAGNAVLNQQNAFYAKDPKRYVDAASGTIVNRVTERDPITGALTPSAKATGQTATLPPPFPPKGSRSMDPKEKINTQGTPAYKTTPYDPVVTGRPHVSGGGRSHKKSEE